VVSILRFPNSPDNSVNSNAVIVPHCGAREKSFLEEIA